MHFHSQPEFARNCAKIRISTKGSCEKIDPHKNFQREIFFQQNCILCDSKVFYITLVAQKLVSVKIFDSEGLVRQLWKS